MMNPADNTITEEDVIWHTLVVGSSGSGKTNCILYWFLRLFKRKDVALIFIDPAGDAAIELVRRIDKGEWGRVALLDPREVTFGLNPLALPATSTGQQKTQLMERQVDEFSILLSDVFNTDAANAPRLMWILKGALYFLYGSTDSPTFHELYDLLIDFMKHSREESAELLRGGNVNEGVVQKTIEAIAQLPKEAFSAVINRISNFVLPPKSVTSRTFCSIESRLDVERMAEPGRLTIFRLADRNLSEGFRQVFSATIVMKLYFTSLRRANRLENEGRGEEARTPIVLAIDEFQNVSPLKVLDTILSQSRKFGLFLWMAFQNAGLIRKELLNSILGNAGSMFVYLLGPDDARLFGKVLLPGKEKEAEEQILKLTRGKCLVRKNPVGGSVVASTFKLDPHPKVKEPFYSINDALDFMHREMDREYGGAVESTAISYGSSIGRPCNEVVLPAGAYSSEALVERLSSLPGPSLVGSQSDGERSPAPKAPTQSKVERSLVEGKKRRDLNKSSVISATQEKLIRAKKARAYVLWCLCKFGFSTRENIQSSGHLSVRTVSRCLSELEEQGLIERKGKSVVVTSAGRGLLEKAAATSSRDI